MKQIIKVHSKRWLGLLLALCLAVVQFPLQALAQEEYRAYVIHLSVLSYYEDFLTAWSSAGNGDTVGLLQDKELSKDPVTLSSGSRTVELNGHKFYRHNGTDHDNGELFRVKNGASLSVYGGRLNWTVSGNTVTMPSDKENKIAGTFYDANGFAATSGTAAKNTVWNMCFFDYQSREVNYEKENPDYAVSGGLLSGGWSSENGGAIRMLDDNTAVALYDVTVAGNIAEDNGGGIAMHSNYQKLTLVDSSVSFNRAVSEDGGGIFVDGEYCKIYSTRSQISYNLAEDNGGGIAVNKANATIAGDAVRLNPTDTEYPANWSNSTFINHPYAHMNGERNPFWGRNENSSSKHIGTVGKTSTLAYNIVYNSDYDGGGGGIYVDEDCAAIGGFNIIKNLALGFGLNATWCGRGGAVLLNDAGSTVANCNIWKNWTRSEGGGVFVDDDNCALTDVTVTENYSYTNGWSGGGVYVLGTVNLSLGGLCIIQNNKSAEKSNDNLYLGYYNTMYARLYLSVKSGSKIGLWMSGAATDITKVPGEYDERMCYSDESGYHIEYKDQILVIVKGQSSKEYLEAKYPEIAETELVPENPITEGSRTKKLTETYTSDNQNEYPLYQGVAEFPSFADSTKDLTSTFFYSDGYFDGNPKTYNSHLATASMHLALSAFYSNDGNEDAALYNQDGTGTYYPAKSNNIRQFLSDIGVAEEDIFLNDFNIQKPGQFTIGVAIGSKTVTLNGKQKKLVVVGVRGGGYEQEWVSNMTLGASGEAKGFGSAADQVFTELTKYLQRKGIDGESADTLFWVAGFSRAGATSNLTGARIVDRFDTNGTHTFVYTFEAPQGGMSTVRKNAEKYYCIHNIINDTDLVPQVGPSDMGFQRYGVDHYVPGNPTAGTPTGKQNSYQRLNDAGTGAQKETYTTYSDNKAYAVGSSSYNAQKAKMQTQLKYIADYDLIFSDYFHTATISYMGNTFFGNFGWQMIDEDSDLMTSIPSDKRNAAEFTKYFITDLQEKVMNFMSDSSGNRINGLYRSSYSQATLEGTTIEQAAADAAGVVFSLNAEQMEGLSEIAGTLMGRIDTKSFYFGYLKANVTFDRIAARCTDSLLTAPITIGSDPSTAVGLLGAVFAYKSTDEMIDTVWKELNIPSATEMKDTKVAEKYKADRAKGYKFLQDVLTDEQIAKLKKSVPALGFFLLEYLKKDYDKNDNDVLGTLVYNVSRILSNHYPENDLAWLRTYDSYYADQNSKTVIAASAQVKEVLSPIANGTDSSEVTVSCTEPVLKLEVPNDVNSGAGIFYRFVGENAPDTDWHPYCGALTLETGDTLPLTYTLETYAIHDRICSKTRKIKITVAGENLLTYSYPDEQGNTVTRQLYLEVGKTYSDIGVPTLTAQSFGQWTCTEGDISRLDGFDLNARTNTFTVLKKGSYTLQADYYEKSNAVSLTLDKIQSDTLPETATLTAVKKAGQTAFENAGNVSLRVSWIKESTPNTYTATVFLPTDEARKLCYIGQPQGTGFTAYDTVLKAAVNLNEDNLSSVQHQGNAVGIVHADGSAEVKQTFVLYGYTDPDDICTVTLKAWDINTNQATDFATGESSISYTFVKGNAVTLPLPAVTSEQFTSVKSSNLSDTEYTVSDGALHFIMPDKNVSIVLNYKPVLYQVTVVVDQAPETAQALPNYISTVATIENRWAVTDGITAEWRPSGSKAAADTIYTLALSLDETSLIGAPLSGGNTWNTAQTGASVPLAGAFDVSNDLVVTVVTPDGTPLATTNTVLRPTQNSLMIFADFPPTAKLAVTDITPPNTVSVPNGSTPAEICTSLPQTVDVTLSDGTHDQIAVRWTLSDAVPSLDGYAISAQGTLADDDTYEIGNMRTVNTVVTVLPAEQTTVPQASLTVGGIPTDAGSYGETVSVGDSENYSVKLVLTAESGAKIKYIIDGQTYDYAEPIEIGWGNESAPNPGDTKSVTVQAFAEKTNARDSAIATYTYELSVPMLITPTPAEYKIIEGANGKWQKTTSDNLSFTSDAPFEKFDSVKVDNAVINKKNYAVVPGSTKVTLYADYLQTLSIGQHSFAIVSTDGAAATEFTVCNPASNKVKIKYEMNGHGQPTTEQAVDNGTKGTRPTDPTAEGYQFGGWYIDAECTVPYDFDSVLTEDITLFAKWIKDESAETETDEDAKDDDTSKDENPVRSPKTGEDVNCRLLWILVILSGMTTATTLAGRKKKKHSR